MAKRETQAPPQQPAEDMFGRPMSARDEGKPDAGREAQGAHQLPEHERKARPGMEEEEEEAARERACGGVGDLPDGDGVRSDQGTNPLPSSYWSAYADQKPETD
ncbi:hypothetical protein [Cystobacter ferrugineus]|uniref:Uncharacterized protein n=1 Tax=Cystobacter ferrugineus TaxID=83449 RepID=A0A1L9B2E2_9BACT|nr:hypothetical protein [Cystobacter ferrugineus]OJH36400.1 hypothetical protein BON30_31995 [Cystobacter ferrugineus]